MNITTVKEYLSKINYSKLFIVLQFIIIIALGYFLFNNKIGQKPPEVIEVPNTNPNTLNQYIPSNYDMTKNDIDRLSRKIDEVTRYQAPQYHYYTYSEEVADETAQEYAKKDKADFVIKNKEQVKILDGASKKDQEKISNIINTKEEEQKKNKQDNIIENNYYAISLERKHSIELGAKYIDNTAYVATSYRNRDVRYEVVYSPDKNKWGAGISYTIAKW